MKKLFLLLLSFTFVTRLFSQLYYYEEGFVIKNNGDTLKGYIERLSESKMSFKINFLDTLGNQKPEVYQPNDIVKFCFIKDSVCFYPVEYVFYKDGEKYTVYRLAKILMDGNIRLFKLQLPEYEQNIAFEEGNTYVYVLRMDGKNYVLNQVEKFVENNQYWLDKKYIKVLQYLFEDCPEIQKKIERTKFNDNAIISIINEYNVCKGYDEKISYKVKLQYYHGFNLSYNYILYSDLQNHCGYALGYNLKFIKPDLNENISFNIGIQYFHLNKPLGLVYDVIEYRNELIYGRDFIRFPLYSGIRFFKGNVKPVLIIGVVPLFSKHYFNVDALYGIGIEWEQFDFSINLSCQVILPLKPLITFFTLHYYLNKN